MDFKVSQGVTTVIAGNCGISAAPLRARHGAADAAGPARVAARRALHELRAYLDALRATPSSVNVAAMVGHSTLRAVVMPDLDRPANAQEIAAMQALVEERCRPARSGCRPAPSIRRR
jgi:N-acyl-D-amino-acid deacylase